MNALPGPPLPPESADDRPTLVLIWLAALFAVLLVALIFLALNGDGSTVAADTSTTVIPASSVAATTAAPVMTATTAAPATTAVTVAPPTTGTTVAPPTTGTTVAPPTTGTTVAPTTTLPFPQNSITAEGSCATKYNVTFRLASIEPTKFDGYTRLTFFFEDAGIWKPMCSLWMSDPNTVDLMVFPTDLFDPFPAGIFDGNGYFEVGLGSVIGVDSGMQGGGSGEWVYRLELIGTKAYVAASYQDPTRLVVDIED